MPKIKIRNNGQELTGAVGSNLLSLLRNVGAAVDNPCSGKGVCGKCKVKIIKGKLSDISETERQMLKPEEIFEGIRLACTVDLKDDIEIELLWSERAAKVMTDGYLPDFSYDFRAAGYGVAADIGTTTVVAVLIDLRTGREVAKAAQVNAQKKFGLDVLTRITYECENPETGAEELRQIMIDSLNEMILELCVDAKINRNQILEVDVAANCTMLHMLLGIDARPIGRSPYQPLFLAAKDIAAVEAGIKAASDARLYCLPSVSAYIGADIVAGAYVCGLHKENRNVLFIDIGTNGEIVLATGGRLLSCSCAAGPALEGMNISSGMRAAMGAVEDVSITESGVVLKTIGNAPPAGICGSGILAAVKELLRTGLVKPDGAFIKKETLEEKDYRYPLIRLDGRKREFLLCKEPEMVITQKDIRQVQLAKGAILSGFRALLHKASIDMKDLDKVMIAGQFGAHLPGSSLTGTGILPAEVEDKLTYVGNSSKTGAYMALMSEEVKRELEELAGRIEYMELAETKQYERLFIESLSWERV